MYFLLPALVWAAGSRVFQYPGAQPPPSEVARGFGAITVKDAKRVLTFLATECEGRGSGQPGFEKAAQYMARQFKSLGLKPLGDGGTYFQTTDFTRWRYEPESVKLSFGGAKISGQDLDIRGGQPELSISVSKIAYVEAPNDATDLGGATFKDEIVFLKTDRRSGYLEAQMLDTGAKAVFWLAPTHAENTWRPKMGERPPNVPERVTGFLSKNAQPKFMADLAKLPKTEAKTPNGITVQSFDVKAELHAERKTETVKVGNVVAELPGSDPTLSKEYVGVGGHLDHLGDQDGVIYPGADDDGSGATSVVEIARAFVANPLKPKRSIVFMTFFGEEMGLLGSSFLTAHPPIPLDDMVSELQMDMVGRDSSGAQNGDPSRTDVEAENHDTIRLVGSKRISTELDKLIQDENRYIGFHFKYDAEDVYTRSDHYNFAKLGVPIAFLFDGFHPDYHRPTDTIDKIDWLKLTNAAKLYYLTAMALANSDHRPVKDVGVAH